ncbi:hypothetical protein L218DRAFT_862733, partial [Marasmius fiardii PR-910]
QIYWISREARRLMGKPTNTRYNSIVAIIIESGVLYAASIVASVAVNLTFDPHSHGLIPFNLEPVATLMLGLAPTMIIVRVAAGKSVDSVQQMVSTLQFQADAQGSSQRSRPAADLQLQTQIGGQAPLDSERSLPMPEIQMA